MTLEFLKGLLGATTSCFSAAGPNFRKAKAEREAGQNPYSVPPSFSDKQFEDALRTLGAVSADDSTIKQLLADVKALYVRPENFSKPHTREWLSRTAVQNALKAMARAAIANDPVPLGEQEIAQAAYTEISGENKAFAQSFVLIAVQFIKASIYSGIKDPALGVLCESAFNGIHARFDSLSEQVRESTRLNGVALAEHHGADAEAELEAILMRRGDSESHTLADLYQLIDKLEAQGIYFGAPARIRHTVLDWIVRHEASQDNLEGAESALQRLLAEHVPPSLSAQAWHLVAKGDRDAALRLLRGEDSAEARSTIFAILRDKQDAEAARAFFDELEPHTPESFTAAGWGSIAFCLAGLGDVERAISILAALPEGVFQKWPILWLMTGVLNASMIVQPALRRRMLIGEVTPPPHHTLEGKEADGWRTKAITSFEKCTLSATSISYHKLAKICSFWLRWLRLADPKTRQDERQKLAEAMTNVSEAVDLMPLAHAIELQFNTTPLWRHINRMEKLGGLPAPELHAKLRLLLSEERFSDLSAYIETEWLNLNKVFSDDFLSAQLIEAYANAFECERAEATLKAKQGVLSPATARQLQLMIQDRRGNDPTNQAWENYKESGEFIDLLNLVSALTASKRWSDATPFALKLFEHEPNAKNAQRYIECLMRSNVGSNEVVTFLDACPDLVEQDSGLRAARAWALLHTGDLNESKSINDRLLAERSDPNDVKLAIHLSIRLGEWERFPALLERIWERREEFDPETLLLLASLTAGSTKDRALALIMHCCERYHDNPDILLKISSVALSMGKDDIAMPLIHRAAELPAGEKKLVWQVRHSEMPETLKSISDKNRKMTELFRTAQIPIHWAADEFNMPLCGLLIANPRSNKEEPDARRRNPIPAFAGNRPPISLDRVASIALDLSSAYLLNELNLLRRLLDSLDIIYLSPRFFEALYHEREAIRFHQPSRISAAKPLLQMVRQGKLSIASAEAPRELADEVGQETAELLFAARRDGGVLVHAGKIWRVTSFMEEEAQLGEFKVHVTSPDAVAKMLYIDGQIPESLRDSSLDYLRKISEGEESNLTITPEMPIILDQVCADYLSKAGILRELVNPKRQVFICSSAVDEWQALVDSEQYSGSIIESLDSIRQIIKDGIIHGKVRFVREKRIDQDDRTGMTSAAFLDIFENFIDADAICIDDRMLNKNTYIQDRHGKSVYLICTLDIVNMLTTRGVLSKLERRNFFHTLREWCIALVPLDVDHVFDELKKCHATQDGNIAESAVLRVLREYISRLHTSGLLCTAPDVDFLFLLGQNCLEIIKKIWADSSSEIADIHARANWIFDYIMPDAELALRPFVGGKSKHEELTAARILGTLAADGIPGHRKELYAKWIDFKFVGAHRPASRGIVDNVAMLIQAHIEKLPAEIEDGIERNGSPSSIECNAADNTRQVSE